MNEIGKFLRKYRIELGGVSLREMAEKLSISPSLLSSYETGRRSLPDGDAFFDQVVEKYGIEGKDIKRFRNAIDSSLESYRIDLSGVDPEIRDQYVAFARRLPGFSPDDFAALGDDFKDDEDE